MTNCPNCKLPFRGTTRIRSKVRKKCFRQQRGNCSACRKLAAVEHKIEDARRALELLLDEREKLAYILNEHHDPFVNRLPLEIVSSIFIYCRPNIPDAYTSEVQFPEKQLIKAVFLSGHICKHWRRIAQSSPQLWNVLCATITRNNCISSVTIVDQWLRKSGDLPLFIQLGMDEGDNKIPVVVGAVHKVLTSVLLHAQRWEVLDLTIPSHLTHPISIALSDVSSLALLDHLKISIANHDGDLLQFQAAPRRLTFRDSHDHWNLLLSISPDSINLHRLTDFFADFMTDDETRDLFRQAPRLATCRIMSLESNNYSMPSMLCPSLQTFMVGEFDEDLFDTYSFPSLKHLHIKKPLLDEDEAFFRSSLARFISRSACRIEELVVEDLPEEWPCEGLIVDTLALTPDLKHLSVKGNTVVGAPLFCAIDEAATPALENLHASPDFLKKLESLSCSTNDLDFDWSDLITFLTTMTSRRDQSLQSFKFEYEKPPPSGAASDSEVRLDQVMFKQLMDATHGLEVKLVDHKGGDLVENLRRRYNL